MSEIVFQILTMIGLVLAVALPITLQSKSKTWFKGWGACEWLNSTCTFSKARPRSDTHYCFSNEPKWLCDNHYEETLRIKEYVNRVSNERRVVSTEEAKRFKESGHRTW